MAFDAFLKIEGIDGESTDKTHPGEIEVTSFSWGVSNTGSTGTRRRRRRRQGGASGLPLLDGDEQGVAEPHARLRDRGALPEGHADVPPAGGGFEFLKIKLVDCLVSSYELGGDNTPPSTSPTRRWTR